MKQNKIKDDLIREFEYENHRCQNYFDLMYKIIQFTFVAVAALVVFAFGGNISPECRFMILCFVLPICTYVFGIMYAYNAYALAVCGERAEIIHNQIYTSTEAPPRLYNMLKKYVYTDRVITLISYGVPLAFYLLLPLGCICLGMVLPCGEIEFLKHMPIESPKMFFAVFAFTFCAIYLFLMVIIIKALYQHYFLKKRKKKEK